MLRSITVEEKIFGKNPLNIYKNVVYSEFYCLFKFLYSYVVQAEITDGVIDMLENETNPITFSCEAIGEPVANISWYFNGELIDVSNASKYIISNSSNGTLVTSLLTIVNTQSSDVGRYTCFAENFVGRDQNSGVLTVNGKNIYRVHMSMFFHTHVPCDNRCC